MLIYISFLCMYLFTRIGVFLHIYISCILIFLPTFYWECFLMKYSLKYFLTSKLYYSLISCRVETRVYKYITVYLNIPV